jgi:ABC-2 type transport system permease protein
MTISRRRLTAIVYVEWHVLRRDPAPVTVYVLMPLLVMGFLKPALRLATLAEDPAANGAEQAVPGVTVMFAFFLVSLVGIMIYREHGWHTWDRLRASSASTAEIMLGKVVAPLAVFAAVLTCLLAGGGVLFDLRVKGSYIGLVLVAAALAVCLVSLGLALVAICRTAAQFVSIANLGAIVSAGLGGAVVPHALLPGWVRALSPISPSYWAMAGFHGVIVKGWGWIDTLRPAAVLVGEAAVFAAVAVAHFRTDERKVSFS